MAINNLNETGLKRIVIHSARAIVSREAIHKSRSRELNKILGRLKECLEEDELVVVVKKEFLREAEQDNPFHIDAGQPMQTAWRTNNRDGLFREGNVTPIEFDVPRIGQNIRQIVPEHHLNLRE